MDMKFNGTVKQNRWAVDILNGAELSETQIDNLLRWAGPAMHSKKIMDVTIVIDNRFNLAEYADALGKFYQLSQNEKRTVAKSAAVKLKMMAKT